MLGHELPDIPHQLLHPFVSHIRVPVRGKQLIAALVEQKIVSLFKYLHW
jgi:hypothetical protein